MTRIERSVIAVVATVCVAAYLAVGGLFGFAQLAPYRPRTFIGWLLLLAAVPIVSFGTLFLAKLVDEEPIGRQLRTRSGLDQSRWIAGVYFPVRTLVLLGLLLTAVWLAVSRMAALQVFLTGHFGPDV